MNCGILNQVFIEEPPAESFSQCINESTMEGMTGSADWLVQMSQGQEHAGVHVLACVISELLQWCWCCGESAAWTLLR